MASESPPGPGKNEQGSKTEALPLKGKEPEQLIAKSTESSEVDLSQELIKEKQRADECVRRLMYLQADFENYRKRVESESALLKQLSNEELVSNLLSVVDELELAIQTAKRSTNSKSLVTGVEMVLKKLQNTLGKEGLSKIQTISSPFDPNMHEVVSMVAVEDKAEGTIIQEVRSGYMLKGKVIRPSMVTIASSTKDAGSKKETGVPV